MEGFQTDLTHPRFNLCLHGWDRRSKPRSELEERQPHSPHSEQRHAPRTRTPALLANATHAPG